MKKFWTLDKPMAIWASALGGNLVKSNFISRLIVSLVLVQNHFTQKSNLSSNDHDMLACL